MLNGLTTETAKQLLLKYGENVLKEKEKKSLLVKFFEQFNNFLTLLLIVAAFFSFIINEPIDGVLIIAIVILNAIFGIYQEAKAEESIASLKKMSVTKTRVIRDGIEQEILSNYLVPGDICIVEEGVKIAADGKIIESRNIEINEAVLTGESLPVIKNKDDEVFSGTIIAKGRGIIEITKTGMQTKFGQIAHQLNIIKETNTPLQIKLEKLTKIIGIIGVLAALLVFVISITRGESYFPTFLLAISLAVAVVPEGLPAVMTITLAIGVKEMSKKKSIIRKLSAIEALGGVTLIATDKTGTLTTNKMKIKEVYLNNSIYSDQWKEITDLNFRKILENGILCSTASLVYKHDHNSFDVLGDPTEGAILYLAQEININIEEERKKNTISDELPFDSITKLMSVYVKNKNIVYTKGAPESIIETCSYIQKENKVEKLSFDEKQKIEKQIINWARKGLRVLAFSYKEKNDDEPLKNINDSIFIGMIAIYDAPRPNVKEAVEKAQKAGIRVVMITGDNERTAEAIGVTAGIIKEGEDIITGKQLEKYNDKELMEILPRVAIFARTTPFHKHRIVSLYQKLGEIVAVTGDGVNDAIALKQADIGIAMGLVGTDVARETADMIITDDNFASIVTAIEEGRNIIKNLKNAIQYLLSCNISEAITLIGGIFLGFNHILYPLQLLYINLVTDGVPALSLSFSPRSNNTMSQKPQKNVELLQNNEQIYIFSVGIITSFLTLSSYWIFLKESEGIAKTAVFSVLTLIQSFIFIDLWLSHRSFHKNLKSLTNPIFIIPFFFPFITQFIIVKFPFIAKIFNVNTASFYQFGIFIFISSLVLIFIRKIKKILKLYY